MLHPIPSRLRYTRFTNVVFYVDGECTQTIIHPCVSVWCVATLPNGDIVSGGSDGFVRIFTRTAERVADAATLKAYDEENAAASIPS